MTAFWVALPLDESVFVSKSGDSQATLTAVSWLIPESSAVSSLLPLLHAARARRLSEATAAVAAFRVIFNVPPETVVGLPNRSGVDGHDAQGCRALRGLPTR